MSTTIRVIPRRKMWAVQRDGTRRAANIIKNKENAITRAKEIAKRMTPSILIVHGKDGTEQFSHNYNS